jgi:hypothetical protein
MLLFRVVGLGALLMMTLLFFPGLHGHGHWSSPLWFLLTGLHQGSYVRAPYATWFTTAAIKDRGGSRCYRPWVVATCVAGLDYRIDVFRATKGGYVEHL